ncbi:MAG: hypothetical protein NTZ43_02155 [Gemmatimonadetes bacterium]|nr:hypothetical protein [Gemmatimonadota bacterium]
MELAVRVEPTDVPLPAVAYRWDADTDILTASMHAPAVGEGMSGSVEVEGGDGSWLIFDVSAGRIAGVEVAVWPDVRKVATLAPPADAAPSRVSIPARRSQPGIAALEVETELSADADVAERTIHFRIGAVRPVRHVLIARDLALDVDERERVAGVWLLNVPPFPAES